MLAPDKQSQIKEWNSTKANYPSHKTIHQVFEEQVNRSPEALALVMPSLTDGSAQHLTYHELDCHSQQLAFQLQQLGVGSETLVAIVTERTIEMIVAILAILKAGGVYVPIDPSYPADRIAFMLEDTRAAVLLTQADLSKRLPQHQSKLILLDNICAQLNSIEKPELNCSNPVNALNLAYINYTSGSTGRPKGVSIPHQAILRLLFGTSFTPLDQDRVFLQLAPISFDAATLEVWGPLLHGGCCVLFPGNGIPDLNDLDTVIHRYGITTLWLTAALFNTVVAEAPQALLGVKEILTGGEALSVNHIRIAQERLSGTQLVNGYGPTESTTFTCCYRIPNPVPSQWMSIPIGRAIANTQTYILDSDLQPVPIGASGELYIGGDGLAREYLNQPEVTQERFISLRIFDGPTIRLYKTGDIVRYLPDGNLEFIGRIDNQVKISGHRIELGEIEAVLSQYPDVRDAVVIVREDSLGDKRLVAYVTTQSQRPLNISELKNYLKRHLADFMVPSAIVVLDRIPLTPNGKANRQALPKPVPNISNASFIAPATKTEQTLTEIWCGILGLEQVGTANNFFDLGGTSILGLQLISRIQKYFNSQIKAVLLYQYPTISGLARHLDQELRQDRQQSQTSVQPQDTEDTSSQSVSDEHSTSIAIIGMVGRFPGAQTVEALWNNLCLGIDSVTFFKDTELDLSENTDIRQDSAYVPAKGILEGAETFDAAFFDISPREAEVMDPQARIFLELAYEALESSGYTSDSFSGLIGLFGGSGQNTYFERHICGRPEVINRLGAFQTMLANEKDFVTSRTSYKLNLTGPSISVSTACSTSLVAIIQAVQSLNNHDCDVALAGGISVTTPQNVGYLYQEGGMLSPDGKCRPFDAEAKGTTFNNGAGIVVLKRLKDALEQGDYVYAVIKGVGINNDGSDKVSFTAPSVNGQREAILKAHLDAGINPEAVSYIETHGTATPLGDPIEIEALTQAFRHKTGKNQFCAIGSIKSNVGHLVAAAGVTGLIKTALSLHHQKIPASLNYKSPNPEIDFKNSPFYVNHQLTEWKSDDKLRLAGVSSFGVGGTNAHVVLEEAPLTKPSGPSRPYQLLLISAKTDTALQRSTENLKNYFERSSVSLADAAYTLQQGRRMFNYRRFAVCQSLTDAVTVLDTLPPQLSAARCTKLRNPDVIFMFPGQGSQYVGMGLNLYGRESVFRSAVDRCAKILEPLLELNIKTLLYPSEEHAESAAQQLRQTIFTQPALFTVEYALAMLWQSWGIQPAAMIGHSIGEFVAACLAGVFTLEDALMLVATRGRMMWELPPGSMLSIRLPATEVEPQLSQEMAIAAINGPSLCVVSGPTHLVSELKQQLESQEIICKPLHTSHAFHSPMMDGIIEPFFKLLQTVKLSSPSIPFISTVSATWITHEQATDPSYWAGHLRATVRFAEGVKTLWEDPHRVLLEVGPRTTAATLARQQATDLSQQIAISSLGNTAEVESEWLALTQAIGQLWLAGVEVDWKSFYADETRSRTPLPTYPFERQRYWIDAKRVPSALDTLANPSELQLNKPISAHDSIPVTPEINPQIQPTVIENAMSRQHRLIPQLKEILEDTSGLDISSASPDLTFLEMGLDSLSLTQVAITLKKKFKVKIAFRNLLEDYPTVKALATFLDQTLPAEAVPELDNASETPKISITLPASLSNGSNFESNGSNLSSNPVPMSTSIPMNPPEAPPTGEIAAVVAQQLQIMSQQLELLRGNGSAPATVPPSLAASSSSIFASKAIDTKPIADSKVSEPKAAKPPQKLSGPGAKIEKTISSDLTTEQRGNLDRIIHRYVSRTSESKRQTQEHRKYLADPRTVSGFSPLLKEMVYPIVVDRSAGSKLWDVDGNEYVDITNGFGLNFFGWNPDFVKEAVIAQMDKGFEIGPQTPLAGRVAKLISEFTGMERVAFCNTGSEAVMATLRLARTVTGRDLVATFAGDYHGTFDEVLYRPGAKLKTMPAAPGILPNMFENLLVLDYGTPESLEILRSRADDLAAVLVEPVRSRDPELQPKAFLQDLRQLTEQSGTAYIFDEVVTGFRVAPGGAQAYFDIRADMATYGKIVGGGLPIGIVAGKAEYMDALDGGFWQYGDASIPEVGVTFFAGTFVRHPLALAAAEAVLLKLKGGGSELQQSLAIKVHQFATDLNQHFARVGAPIKVEYFTSYFYISYPAELPYAQLLFYQLREKGVHVWDHRPCFFTLAHTDNDIQLISRAFKDSVAELQSSGFLPAVAFSNGNGEGNRNQQPQPGARLGKNPEGDPAWYIPDPDRPGKYLQVGGVS